MIDLVNAPSSLAVILGSLVVALAIIGRNVTAYLIAAIVTKAPDRTELAACLQVVHDIVKALGRLPK